MDTIFALSSGSPPAAIGIIRISGPAARQGLERMAGTCPEPRVATLRPLRDSCGELLDTALLLWFPGPNTATGEDVAELHVHGGRAVVAAIERELASYTGFRAALPGEFTRRAFANGRIDLAEAEGLADLLVAETELQRRVAVSMASGSLSERVARWRDTVLQLSAVVEAELDFSDEDDVGGLPDAFYAETGELSEALARWLDRPRAERLREGIRVVFAGPPNAGKSSLFNALLEDEAAITAPTAGTTRDVLERHIALNGIPFTFVDTAGLRDDSGETVETIGIARARAEMDRADVVLWLGDEGGGPARALEIDSKSDLSIDGRKSSSAIRVSAVSGAGLNGLKQTLIDEVTDGLPKPGNVALNDRQHTLLRQAQVAIAAIGNATDLLLIAEHLRVCRNAFDMLIGRSSTESMLDSLFGRFCIGK